MSELRSSVCIPGLMSHTHSWTPLATCCLFEGHHELIPPHPKPLISRSNRRHPPWLSLNPFQISWAQTPIKHEGCLAQIIHECIGFNIAPLCQDPLRTECPNVAWIRGGTCCQRKNSLMCETWAGTDGIKAVDCNANHPSGRKSRISNFLCWYAGYFAILINLQVLTSRPGFFQVLEA